MEGDELDVWPVIGVATSVAAFSWAVVSVWRAIARARLAVRGWEQALILIRGFRRAVLGVCGAAIVAGTVWQIAWLWQLALIICAEEVLESSVLAATLRNGLRRTSSEPSP